ncbi:MAG: hypothetical protein IJ667_12360, partial [Synergistaceae bacterium]|nr:hypothetical protein [Synergistaceae bacterium]
MLKLLFTRRFMPLFMTQFLGAFNDNFFKSALIMLITYKIGDAAGIDPRILVNAAAGVFIVFGLISSIIFIGETVTIQAAIGCALIFIAVLMVELRH